MRRAVVQGEIKFLIHLNEQVQQLLENDLLRSVSA